LLDRLTWLPPFTQQLHGKSIVMFSPATEALDAIPALDLSNSTALQHPLSVGDAVVLLRLFPLLLLYGLWARFDAP